VLGWWFAFTRDIRRERTFTIDDMPLVRAYGAGQAGLTEGAPSAAATAAASPTAESNRDRSG
jgi:hypothetical protein